MQRTTLLMMGLLYLLISSCSQNDTSVDSYIGSGIPKDTVDAFLQQKMKDFDIPGMSIAIMNDGKVVHHKLFGYSNKETQERVTDKTIFEAASLSKPIFAYFVMKFVEEGKLDLDRPLHEYLPYPDIAHDARYKKITARMVLSHRSGFPNWRTDLPDDKLILQFEPGTAYFYSGEGYQYLAMVLKEIEQIDWEGLEALFQEKVARPLGMEHTVFIQDAYSIANKAEPYDEKGLWISPDRDIDSTLRYRFIAPASIHTEAIDFSKWLIGLSQKKGLTEESFKELYTVHSYVEEFGGIKVDYTLGFMKPQLPLSNLYLHGGNNYGFTAFMTIDPDRGWGFVLFTNSEYGEQLGGELAFYLLTGPNTTGLLITVIAVLLLFLTGLILLVRFIIRSRKRNRAPI